MWESAQFNNRLQVTQLGLGTSATDTSQWKLDYDFGTTDNNGNPIFDDIPLKPSPKDFASS